ncbi:hypothetical protein Nepgr_028889 [Nepenthes gracilis]|uniref:Cytochrome P450 n=1 Tax=Nepenthes gracilis TaxID=150966 RepID=A0AAD3Y506_NEPGR|nr:hypothetical protein Nepgr_028889 [Nepenthes gracilis]
MELCLPVQIPYLATLFFLLLFLYYVLWRRNNNHKRQPPTPAGSWPILGHINLLRGSKVLHIVLANLANEYGPILTIKLGIREVLVVSSPEIAKECLVDNDKVFVNRPQTVAVKRLAYNSAMFGFAPYGPYWRELRKIATFELLSNHRLDILEHVRIFEVRNAVKSIYDKWAHARKDIEHDNGILVEMKRWFGNLSLKVTTKLVAGSTSKELFQNEEYDRYYESIREFFHYFGLSTISDAFPFMRWLDIGKHEKAMKRVAKELDEIIQGWLDKHRRGCVSGYQEKGKQDFMGVMLDTFDTAHENLSKFELDTIIKATCLMMRSLWMMKLNWVIWCS